MKTFILFKNYKIMLGAVFLTIFDTLILPSTNFFWWLIIAMGVDLVTGLYKSWHLKIKITSAKLRSSVAKIIQYAGCILAMVILSNFAFGEKHKEEINLAVTLIYSFLILIEVKSIIENISAVSPNSPIARYVFKPILRLLNIRLSEFDKKATEEEKQQSKNEDITPHN